jgi:hypothetical protein
MFIGICYSVPDGHCLGHSHIYIFFSEIKSLGSRHACAPQEYPTEESVLLCVSSDGRDIQKEIFPAYGRECLSRKAVHNWAANVLLMTKRLKRRCGSGRDNSRIFMLRVLTHW